MLKGGSKMCVGTGMRVSLLRFVHSVMVSEAHSDAVSNHEIPWFDRFAVAPQ